MKRLRLELKQTMDMYNSACKEATSTISDVFFYRNIVSVSRQENFSNGRQKKNVNLSKPSLLKKLHWLWQKWRGIGRRLPWKQPICNNG